MSVNERIFDLLNKHGKTQTDIARLLNVRPTTVSEWKRGKYEPSLAHCIALADFFGVSLDYLITGRESRAAPVQQIIGNNNNNNTAIAHGGGGALTECEAELLKVFARLDFRQKTEVLHFIYQLENK